MKKMNGLFTGVCVLLVLLSSCQKSNSGMDYSVTNSEKVKIKNSLTLSQVFNDTLKMVYDTAKIRKNNLYCIKYDKLYHQNDSIFKVHYSLFGDEMYKNGMMMNNYTPSNNMMQGGMMNRGSMDVQHMMEDTATVGGYFRSMHQLRDNHQIYHNGIYN
jgi:hypothetical protein